MLLWLLTENIFSNGYKVAISADTNTTEYLPYTLRTKLTASQQEAANRSEDYIAKQSQGYVNNFTKDESAEDGNHPENSNWQRVAHYDLGALDSKHYTPSYSYDSLNNNIWNNMCHRDASKNGALFNYPIILLHTILIAIQIGLFSYVIAAVATFISRIVATVSGGLLLPPPPPPPSQPVASSFFFRPNF